jgi:hypothetical protein
MSDKEFFRAKYRKAKDRDEEECVVPTVWIGNQGFDLTPQYEQGEQSAQEHAKWFVSMFKKALDSYHQQQMQEKLEEVIKKIDSLEDKDISPHALYVNGYLSALFDAIEILNHLKETNKG